MKLGLLIFSLLVVDSGQKSSSQKQREHTHTWVESRSFTYLFMLETGWHDLGRKWDSVLWFSPPNTFIRLYSSLPRYGPSNLNPKYRSRDRQGTICQGQQSTYPLLSIWWVSGNRWHCTYTISGRWCPHSADEEIEALWGWGIYSKSPQSKCKNSGYSLWKIVWQFL